MMPFEKILFESVPHVEALKIREEGELLTMLISCRKELIFLNEVAKDFLLLCNGRRLLREIIDELDEIYDVDKNQLTDDLIETIQDLQYKRILRMEAA